MGKVVIDKREEIKGEGDKEQGDNCGKREEGRGKTG